MKLVQETRTMKEFTRVLDELSAEVQVIRALRNDLYLNQRREKGSPDRVPT